MLKFEKLSFSFTENYLFKKINEICQINISKVLTPCQTLLEYWSKPYLYNSTFWNSCWLLFIRLVIQKSYEKCLNDIS